MSDGSLSYKVKVSAFFKTLTGRLVIGAILWSIPALLTAYLALSFAFKSYVTDDIDSQLMASMNSLVGASEISPDGILRLSRPLFDQRFSQPYSGWYWQISEEQKNSFRSRSLWDTALKPNMADRLFDIVVHTHAGPDGQKLRVLEQDIALPESDDRVFRYMIAMDWRKALIAIDKFNRQLAFGLIGVLGGVTIALITQVAFGLSPLKKLRRGIQNIRTGRQSRLSDKAEKSSWGDDLQPVVIEVNALLAQNDKLLARARTHVGNLAHALKTPLAVLQNEIRSSGIDKEIVEQQLLILDRHINHHLKRARISGGGSAVGVMISDRVLKIGQAIKLMSLDKDLTITDYLEKDLFFAGEKEDFDEIIGNVLENSAKWAQRQISVKARLLDSIAPRPMIEICIEDDGPGVPEPERALLFERGQRLDETIPGTGLGLSIVRDIVELYGGRVDLGQSFLGGLEVTIVLPARV